MPRSSTSSSADPPESLPTALLLAAAGGLLDAVVYLNHGHVFVSAMTGNTVLLGISILSHNSMQAIHHAAPLIAFTAGVLASKLIRSRFGSRAHLTGLTFEMAALFLAGWLTPSFSEIAFTTLIAFVSALQVASFRHVGPFSYNSTFVTADLRDTAEGFHDGLTAHQASDRRRSFAKSRDLGLVCLGFLAGAVLGAFAAPRLHNLSFWLAEPLLAVVLVNFLRHDRRPGLTKRAGKPFSLPNHP